MSKYEFNICPNLKKEITLCKARIYVTNIILFESATISVQLFNDKNIVVDTLNYVIEGNEYNTWSTTNDQYLIDLIQTKIKQ